MEFSKFKVSDSRSKTQRQYNVSFYLYEIPWKRKDLETECVLVVIRDQRKEDDYYG